MIVRRRDSWTKRIALAIIALCILVPGAYGFGEKLRQFILVLRTEEGAGFTLVPISNYFLVAAGMTCLLIWAIANGMFRRIEEPKYKLLENEEELDRRDGIDWSE
jgi:hypothetical protein